MIRARPLAEHVELPTWSVESQGPLFRTETEVHRGDVGEVLEIVGGVGKIGWNWRFQTAEGKFQAHQRTGWDGKIMQESRLRLFRNKTEFLQVGEGYHPLGGTIAGVRDRSMNFNIAEARGRFEEVQEPSQVNPIPGDPKKVECREVQQAPPRQWCDNPAKT